MKRLILAACIAASTLVGCTAAAPTAAPTPSPSPVATSTPPPTSTPASTATPAPTASPAPSEPAARQLPTTETLEPGRYFLESGGYRFTFTVTDSGWMADVGFAAVFQGEDPELAIFWPGGDITSLYRRACQWTGTEFEPGPSVNDLAEALASLEDFETTPPAEVTVSGYTGKLVTLTVPMDVDFSACEEGSFQRDPGRHYQAVGQTDEIYVLDLDGERQTVVVSHTTRTPAEVAEQLDDLLDSLEISPI
jgi:hypothetical protein